MYIGLLLCQQMETLLFYSVGRILIRIFEFHYIKMLMFWVDRLYVI